MIGYTRALIVRDDDSADKPLRAVAANEGRKADGIDLKMDNADLARYQANPVLMYGHNYWGRDGLPIGHAEGVEIAGKQLLMELHFDPGDDFALTVERKLRNRSLNALSIGFEAHDIDDAGVPARWELFETSVVPLPMDAGALVDDATRQLARLLDPATANDPASVARLLDAARAGKVLSKKNLQLVTDAHAALAALLAAASDEEDEDRSTAPPADSRPRAARAAARLT